MTSAASATVWGSLTATKCALLIHGLTSSSHVWHRVASSLAAQDYLVTAPNLIGHGSRVSASSNYHFNSFAEDLRPYLEAKNYSLIIGHSLGGVIALHLLPYLPRSHPTAIVLVDPPLWRKPKQLDFVRGIFVNSCTTVKSAEEYAAENPLWTREDCISRELGKRLCSIDAIHDIFTLNRPWNHLDRLNDISEKWKLSVLLADPAIFKLCDVEYVRPYPHVRTIIVPGAGHWIPSDFPDAIVEEALKRVSELDG